jgi:hypothetical protein
VPDIPGLSHPGRLTRPAILSRSVFPFVEREPWAGIGAAQALREFAGPGRESLCHARVTASPLSLEERPLGRVSKDDKRTRGHPSRRAQERAPQDEEQNQDK